MTATVRSGDRAVLLEAATGRVWLVHLDGGGARKEPGLGVFDPGRLEGTAWGSATEIAGKHLHVLRPTPPDLQATLRRKAQIITPKDTSRIVYELGITPGDRVLESGIGSGAATQLLCHAVGHDGNVVVQELRDDFAQWASANVERAGLADRLEVHLGDLTQGLASGVQGPFDGVLLDQPEPWLAIPHFLPHLAPGARVASYCPQVSQMEATVKTLEAAGFAQVRCLELIERGWLVKERGSRPAFDGLGHTGFLVFARWLGAAASPAPE